MPERDCAKSREGIHGPRQQWRQWPPACGKVFSESEGIARLGTRIARTAAASAHGKSPGGKCPVDFKAVQGINQQKPSHPVFKEAPLKPLPNPIMLRRFSGAGEWHATCASISCPHKDRLEQQHPLQDAASNACEFAGVPRSGGAIARYRKRCLRLSDVHAMKMQRALKQNLVRPNLHFGNDH